MKIEGKERRDEIRQWFNRERRSVQKGKEGRCAIAFATGLCKKHLSFRCYHFSTTAAFFELVGIMYGSRSRQSRVRWAEENLPQKQTCESTCSVAADVCRQPGSATLRGDQGWGGCVCVWSKYCMVRHARRRPSFQRARLRAETRQGSWSCRFWGLLGVLLLLLSCSYSSIHVSSCC